MPLPRKVHAVVFDMDGLLFNTEAIYRELTEAGAETVIRRWADPMPVLAALAEWADVD